MARWSEYYLEMLKAALLESVALATSADLIACVAGPASLSEDVNLDWAIDFKSVNGVWTQMLRAKHANAATVSPVTITPTFRFDPSDEDLRAQVERVFGFGRQRGSGVAGRVLADPQPRVMGGLWARILDVRLDRGPDPADIAVQDAAGAARTLRDVALRDGIIGWLTPGTLG